MLISAPARRIAVDLDQGSCERPLTAEMQRAIAKLNNETTELQ
jgi:hypothetical protein